MHVAEKLPYLVSKQERNQLIGEMRVVDEDMEGKGGITYVSLHKSLAEFKGSDEIDTFFYSCDRNSDSLISVTEYIVCRGEFDKNGNKHIRNEYYLRESEMLHDYEVDRYNSRLKPNLYKYDADGIIIDEV